MADQNQPMEAGTDKAQLVQDAVMYKVSDHDYWQLPGLQLDLSPLHMTSHGLMLILAGLFLALIFGLFYRKKSLIPKGFTNLLEVLVLFVRDQIVIPNLGEKDGRKMAPLFLSFFFFILLLNLMGLIPVFSGATGNVNVTAGLALVTLTVMIGGAIIKNGPSGFVGAFVPHGVPWPVLIILVPIEFMGMFIKAFALTMRLFANMFAGSIVVYSIIGLLLIFGYAGLPALALAIAIYMLKVFVAFLQAFVFTLLSALFINQIHHPAH
jgi:F-type H+-transporting ATPase subunit a